MAFPCRPGDPDFPYDHGTVTVTVHQLRGPGLGFWARTARTVEELTDLDGAAEASYACAGAGSQLYRVQSVVSIDLEGEHGPFPGGTWFKRSAAVRLRC